ncbi:hypothetical protein I79_013595 [Cricetulus griseus]|uniref:Uncharacterized protein n=1 Tax=Cricetulus griseus TaxID=10029 RepID=G3HRX1_CRIGR|nr:hypothetical protein I79_013595 [Cricetulus griseus]
MDHYKRHKLSTPLPSSLALQLGHLRQFYTEMKQTDPGHLWEKSNVEYISDVLSDDSIPHIKQ